MPSQLSAPVNNTGSEAVTVLPNSQDVSTVGVPAIMSSKHSTVKSAGQVISGALFPIVNICTQSSVLPQTSVTVYVNS